MNIKESNHRIIELIGDGMTYAEIAVELGLTPRCVKDRVYEMKKQQGCRNRLQLLAKKLDKNKVSQ